LMHGSALKAKLRGGQLVRGAWMSVPSAAIADTIAHAGFDFIILESEHAPLTFEQLELLILQFRHAPAVPIVRVGWNDQVETKRPPARGPGGALTPLVNSADDAGGAVAACKYPPQGVRGVAPRAAAEFGRKQAEYLATANDRIVVM